MLYTWRDAFEGGMLSGVARIPTAQSQATLVHRRGMGILLRRGRG